MRSTRTSAVFGLVLVIFSSFYKETHGAHHLLLSDQGQQRKKELFKAYNLGKARKQGAINDTLNFLLSQEQQISKTTSSVDNALDDNGIAPVVASANSGELPWCQVSVDRMGKELAFSYRENSLPPYDHQCWLMRTRYNVAEVCQKEEMSKKETNIWEWQYTFKSALKG
jgi:hypothetical protein